MDESQPAISTSFHLSEKHVQENVFSFELSLFNESQIEAEDVHKNFYAESSILKDLKTKFFNPSMKHQNE